MYLTKLKLNKCYNMFVSTELIPLLEFVSVPHFREREVTMGCLTHKSPKFYNYIFLLAGLTFLGTILNFDWFSLFYLVFQLLIVNYRRDNFVYHHWGCTSIYRSLSYPLHS